MKRRNFIAAAASTASLAGYSSLLDGGDTGNEEENTGIRVEDKSMDELLEECDYEKNSLGTEDGMKQLPTGRKEYFMELEEAYDTGTGLFQVYARNPETDGKEMIGPTTMGHGDIYPLEESIAVGVEKVRQSDRTGQEGYANILIFDCRG